MEVSELQLAIMAWTQRTTSTLKKNGEREREKERVKHWKQNKNEKRHKAEKIKRWRNWLLIKIIFLKKIIERKW